MISLICSINAHKFLFLSFGYVAARFMLYQYENKLYPVYIYIISCVFRPSVQLFLCITVLISHLHLLYILICFITSSFHYDKLRFTLFHRIFHHLHFISTHLLSVSINFVLRCFITSSFHYGHVILLIFFSYALCVALSLYGLNTADTA